MIDTLEIILRALGPVNLDHKAGPRLAADNGSFQLAVDRLNGLVRDT